MLDSRSIKILGIMSGTSLDGIDLAICEFDLMDNSNFKILASETINYFSNQKEWLVSIEKNSGIDLIKSHLSYGQFLGETILSFLENQSISVDYISSHGHTIFHQPENGFTFQLGDGQSISVKTNMPVISDFRTKDVILAGQGAPLVPIGDLNLFPDYKYCLNIGGIANYSEKKNNSISAMDICPVNMLLNFYCRKIEMEFDDKGKISQSGDLNGTLLQELNSISYYQNEKFKSLGKEYIFENYIPLINVYNLKTEDILRTLVEHAAQKIGNTLHSKGKCLITGGGAYNLYLIERIQHYSNAEIVIPEKQIIDFKEALIFAYLGFLRIQRKPNCISSVTGSLRDNCGGIIYFPD